MSFVATQTIDGMHTIDGVKIYISQDSVRPKMQLTEGCPVTPDFRIEMNAWMLEFFGTVTENLIPDGQAWASREHGAIHINPRTFARLQRASL